MFISLLVLLTTACFSASAKDCLICPTTLRAPDGYAGVYATYYGSYYYSNFVNRNIASCNYYRTSNAYEFEIECYYDITTGAYVGELDGICLQNPTLSKDIEATPKPTLGFNPTPHTTISPFVICNDNPAGVKACRTNIAAINTACKGLDAASQFAGFCVLGLFPTREQENLLYAGETLTRTVLNLTKSDPLTDAQKQQAYNIFFGAIQSTLVAAGLPGYDDAERALRAVASAFRNAESRICGVAETEPGIIGQADQCGIVAESYRRSCNKAFPGEFTSSIGTRSSPYSSLENLSKRSDNPCSDFLNTLTPFLPDCNKVLAAGPAQKCFDLYADFLTTPDLTAAYANCNRANELLRGSQEICAIISGIKAIEGQCVIGAGPTPSQRSVKRTREKSRLDSRHWNPDARHWQE